VLGNDFNNLQGRLLATGSRIHHYGLRLVMHVTWEGI